MVTVSTADLAAIFFALDWVHGVLKRNEVAIKAAGCGEEARRWIDACHRSMQSLLVAEDRLERPWR